MANGNNISDELLTKFLCGKTSPEETELVLSFMAESDENIEDLKNICAAIEIQEDADAVKVRKRKVIPKRFFWVISSVAAVALVLFISIFVLHIMKSENGGENLVAEVTDTIQPKQTENASLEDSVSFDNTNIIDNKAKPSSPLWNQNQGKNYAGGDSKSCYCNMVVPREAVMIVPLSQTYFEFNWKTDAVKSIITLYDAHHNLISREEIDDDYVRYKVADYQSYQQIYWKLTVTFSDGTAKENSGSIKFE